MGQLIRYESKESGIRVYGPLYQPLEIIINGLSCRSSRKKKEVRVVVDRNSIIRPLLIELNHGTFVEPVYPDEGCRIIPNGKVQAKFIFGYIEEFDKSDLFLDEHVGKIVRRQAEKITYGITNKYELARKVYEYVYGIPFTGERGWGKPRTPTKVITSNKARKCVCKVELYKDLCRVLGIPVREQHIEYYSNEEIKKYSQNRRKPSKNHSHSFPVFFNDDWHLVDPTLGGFDIEFRVKNYYDRLIYARGFDSFEVSAREI